VNFNEYQELSKRTMPIEATFKEDISNYAMGLAGESGEVIDLLKKVVHHNHPLTFEVANKLHEEIGDVMHYVAGLCTLLDFNLEEVCNENIKKLKRRYPEGFSTERSVNRDE
jgi:NTP pyrophosphatase (non-canonical NTP hydrolase)